MKPSILVLLLIGLALTSCGEPARKAGFWVNWTFAPRGSESPPPAPAAITRSKPIPPAQSPRQFAASNVRAPAKTTPAPAVAHASPTAEIPASAPVEERPVISSTPVVTSPETSTQSYPYARPVPGKPGYVFSPYDTKGGYVDVTGYSSGSMVKDPYSGKIFRVP